MYANFGFWNDWAYERTDKGRSDHLLGRLEHAETDNEEESSTDDSGRGASSGKCAWQLVMKCNYTSIYARNTSLHRSG